DVICAPIAPYLDTFADGEAYAPREYWGGPWLERDCDSSQYYYPYNLHLWNTMDALRRRAANMTGVFALTWRLTDAIEPKLWHLSRATWLPNGGPSQSRAVYTQFAALSYGDASAETLGNILDGNEPFASDFGECQGTPAFAAPKARSFRWFVGGEPGRESAKAARQIKVVDDLLRSPATTPAQCARLQMFRCRLAAARDHME